MAIPTTLIVRPFRFLSLNAAPTQAGVTPTGAVGCPPQYAGAGTPRDFTWDYSFAGTAPATVTVVIEGNSIASDAAAAQWATLDTGTLPAGEPERDIVNKNPIWIRARVSLITGGDATTTITVGIHVN